MLTRKQDVYKRQQLDRCLRMKFLRILLSLTKLDTLNRERTVSVSYTHLELHAHTKMSAMDGLNEVENLVETSARWGHKAVAITDHGVVQSLSLIHIFTDKVRLEVKTDINNLETLKTRLINFTSNDIVFLDYVIRNEKVQLF